MSTRILITGSAGLVGRALRVELTCKGIDVVGLDLVGDGSEQGDVRDGHRVRAAMAGCHGVVHLAAVSRVITAEHDPESCWATNVGGLTTVLDAATGQSPHPWFIFASSREVYGQPDRLPATEDAQLDPVNIYGRSKVEGERLVEAARDTGIRTAIVRLSNVYGSTTDHADRVVPAFARAAVVGEVLRVDGLEHTFDFTHIDDTTRGIVALCDLLDGGGDAPPPVHLLTGSPTTLGQLAKMAVDLTGGVASIAEAPCRSFDVSQFYGSPERAGSLLGWKPRVTIQDGLRRFIEDFKVELGGDALSEVSP